MRNVLLMIAVLTAACGGQESELLDGTGTVGVGDVCGLQLGGNAGVVDEEGNIERQESSAMRCRLDALGNVAEVFEAFGENAQMNAEALANEPIVLEVRDDEATMDSTAKQLAPQGAWAARGVPYSAMYESLPTGNVRIRSEYFILLNDGDPTRNYFLVKLTGWATPGYAIGGCPWPYVRSSCVGTDDLWLMIDGNKYGGSIALEDSDPTSSGGYQTSWAIQTTPPGLTFTWGTSSEVRWENRSNWGAVDAQGYLDIKWSTKSASALGQEKFTLTGTFSTPQSYTYHYGGLYFSVTFRDYRTFAPRKLYLDRYFRFDR